MQDRIWSFFCVLPLSSVIYQPIHLFSASYQNRFNQKIYLGKNLEVTIVHSCYGSTSLKRERILSRNNHFLPLLKYIYGYKQKTKLKVT